MKSFFYICKKENFKPTDTSNVRWLEENDDFDLVKKFANRNIKKEDWQERCKDKKPCVVIINNKIISMGFLYKPENENCNYCMVDSLGTIEEYRNKGYAKAVASFITKNIIESGKIPYYSTSETNIASQKVAKSIGYQYDHSEKELSPEEVFKKYNIDINKIRNL